MSQRAIIRQLQAELQEATQTIHTLRRAAAEGFEMQVTIACLLERLTDGGACILPRDLRAKALEEGWGYETMLVPGEEDEPMVVRLLKNKVIEP